MVAAVCEFTWQVSFSTIICWGPNSKGQLLTGGLVNPIYYNYVEYCLHECMISSPGLFSYSDAALWFSIDHQMHWVSVDTSIGASAVCSVLCVTTIF